MLTVSPPLHKDFRARHLFPSSGDGWRCFAPPPLPTVQPAFHFLSSLLEQAVAAPAAIVPKVRPPMDPALYGSLEKMMALPYEVLDLIAANVVEMQSGCSLALASRLFHQLTTRHLYCDVQLDTHDSVSRLARTLKDKPELGSPIRCLSLLCHRPQWVHMHTLAKALADQGKGVTELRVRFQSSDLHEAMPFFACFSPVSFEWITSPCWLMRPAHLFSNFLREWTRLRHLTFGNFRFDSVLIGSVSEVPSLRLLTLKGNGTSHLDCNTLTSLLLLNADTIYERQESSAEKCLEINIIDCPLDDKVRLHSEVDASLAADGPALMAKMLWL